MEKKFLFTKIDKLFFGFPQSNGNEIENAVKMAIDAGYRHIDTAWAYGNEAAIGKAVRSKIAQGVIKRSDIFIVTKVSSKFNNQSTLAENEIINIENKLIKKLSSFSVVEHISCE